VSKIWQALKRVERQREPAVAAAAPPTGHLSPTQRAAVRALLAHGSVGAAAEACGVSAATLERWLKNPDFVAAYHVASRAARARH
jgi:hypothetical protein